MTFKNCMQFTHMGLFVTNLTKMTEFYTREFGLVVTDQGVGTAGPKGVFLSGNPNEHHQLVFVEGRDENTKPTTNQISFLVNDLATLRAYAKHCYEDGIPVVLQKNHGNAWSIYVKDPDNNTVELYCHSPWYVGQPCGKPLDLSESEEQILKKTEAIVLADPSHMSREQWIETMKAKFQ